MKHKTGIQVTNMKEKFKEYLLERYKPTSVNGYISGLNHLAKDYGKDIFKITDLEAVQKIRQLYDLGGIKRKMGDYGNGSARNAIVQYNNSIEDIRTQPKQEPESDSEPVIVSPPNPYERYLHKTMESQVSDLFPGYILIGSEYSIEGVRLDLLLQKEKELLVIELKAGTATYGVFGQISMYMGYIKEKFPEHEVYGVIVASEIHKGLKVACATSNYVTCKKYNMKLSIENA